MKPRHKKLAWVLVGLTGIAVAGALVLNAFQSNLVFFYTPTEVLAGQAPVNRAFRMGGLVEQNSVKREGLKVSFVVTDLHQRIGVMYEGLLPDLFREGQGVVVQGRLDGDRGFRAQQVLAKHDEKYMPPEVADALKRAPPKP